MARDITVTFDDGTSHVYANAPDNVTFDQALSRAQGDFSGRRIANIDGGRKAAPAKPTARPAAESTLVAPGVTDPMGMGGSEIMDVAGPPAGGSIFERGIKMEPPTVDAQKNLEAMQRSGSPESVMFTPGRGLQQAQQIIERGQAQQAQLRQAQENIQRFDAEKLQREKEAQGYYGPVDLAQDIGLAGAKGVVGLGQMGIGLANILTGWYPDNPLGVGQWGKMMDKLGYKPEQTNRFFTGLQTPIAQTQQQDVEAAKGFIDTLKALAINPVALTTMVVESVPGTVMAGAAGGQLTKMLMMQATKEAAEQGLKGYAASKFIANKVKDQVPRIAAAASAAEGAQTAGSIAEQAREQGRDWGQYVAPAIAAGLGTAAIGMVSGKVGQKLGIGDVETDIAARVAGVKGGVGLSKDPFAKALFKEMTKEGLIEELPQGVQEQIFTNLALGQPWDKDIGKSAAQSLVAGAAMGGGHATLAKALNRTNELIREQADQMRLKAERGGLPMTAEELARSKGFLGGRKKSIDELIADLENEMERLDAEDRQKAEGAENVKPPVAPTDRAGVPMAGKPGAVAPAAGAGVSEPTGVVSPRQDVTAVAEGERVEPTAVKPWWEEPAATGTAVGNTFDPTGWTKQETKINKKTGQPSLGPGRERFTKVDADGTKHGVLTQDGVVVSSNTRSPIISLKNSSLADVDEVVSGTIEVDNRTGNLVFVGEGDNGGVFKMSPRAKQRYQEGVPFEKIAEEEFSDAGGIRPDGTRTPHTTTAWKQGQAPTPTTYGQKLAGDIAPEDVNYKGEDATLGPLRDYNLANSPQDTPLLPFITGINKQLDTFYNDLYGKPVNELPETLQKYRYALDEANAALEFIQARLAKWNHPAITGKNQGERAAAKAKATAEDRELLDMQSQIAGGVTRLINQAMALHKGYKGKKAGDPRKILTARNQLDADVQRAIQLLYDRGLLSDEEALEWEKEQERSAIQAEPSAEALVEETPVEEAETPFYPKEKTDEQLEEIVENFFGWYSPKDIESAKAELDQRKGVSEQLVPPTKPEPTSDVKTPEEAGDTTTPDPTAPTPYYGTAETEALGEKIKGVVNSIASDFMVGDMVRYGNVNGVVVGVDDTHVRVHPDGAKSPKAYYRVPKSRVEMIARPDTTSKSAAMAMPGEDKKFGSEQGKLGADMGGLIQVLGANMYASSVAEIAVKELLQNAFDAVKGAVSSKKAPSLYKSGEITITFNDDDRTITVTDNARGMTPEIVRDAFFTIAGSDKSDLETGERSGGFGLAKVGFMLGSDQLILDTVRNGVRVRVDTTAKDIAGNNFQIIKSPAPKSEHGTSVTIKVPEYYIDPASGDQKTIYFSGNPTFYKALDRPLIGPVVVKTIRKSSWQNEETTLPIGLNFPADKYVSFKVNFAWGTADVYFSKERAKSDHTWDIHHRVLSAGVYQFDTDFKMGDEKIPYDIVVNIKPNVDAKHPDYPFNNSREAFKPRLKEDVSSLNTYLAQIARGNEAQDLQENFKNIVSMPRVELGQDIADTTQKLQKSFDRRGTTERRELPPMPTEVRIEGTQVVSVDTGKVLADRAKTEETQTKGTFQAEQAAPEMKEFMLQMEQNPNQPIFHNNTNVDFLEVGRQYGNPEVFFAELGTLMVEMKEALANSGFYKYDQLKPENLFFGGVSIDKGYGGLHIKVPYKAVLINPFYDFGAKTLFGAREFLWETMTHELAHTGDMKHGEGHNTHMLKVRQYLADEGLADYYRDALMDVLTRHESTFTAMREAYGRSTTKNTSKSLKDYEKGSASASDGSAASRDPDSVRPLPAGRGPSGDEILRAAGTVNPTSGIPRAAGSDAPASVKGLGQDVVDAINRNDIRATLQAIARNTSGFYSELANRLSALNLPTSIIFNNQRALVKKVIDDRSAQQQIRLFAYLSREAPEFYDRYFKDYDKAENLERVYEGLRKLPGAGISIAPVNADLADVRYAYNKSMPGLTAPGFFAPTLDTVNIAPDSKFGTSYRVLLHEIVHAATDYLLAEKVPLTPEQAQAKKDLLEMYAYAQTKLAPGEYGFTNISEFVAEVMTNKKFQDKLKGIQYTPRKTSLFNRFLQVISDMFGLDNLAGASMSAINELMSAQRPAGISPMPLVFAKGKRVRGPVSKPDSWRTAESVQTTIQESLSDATKGRVPLDTALKELFNSLWDANATAVRAVILPVLQLRQLKDITRTKFPQLTAAVNIVEKMVAYRGQKIKAAEDIVQRWTKLQSENPKQSGLMGRIMLEATIRARDPDDGVPPGGAPDALDNAWNALTPEFQSLYRNVRDFYADSVKEMVRTMKQRALGLPKAQRQAMIRKINEQFGPQKLAYPYFPLRRFGTKWFQIGKGEFKEFYTFQDSIGRNLAFNKRRRALLAGNKQQQAAAETMRMGNGISELYSQNIATTQVLRDVESTIDNLTATDAAGVKAELKDSLNQLIYLLLPQQSMRKMFINRRAIQGASGDMLRVFAHTAVHSAYQQARFKYAEPFVNNINNARSYIDELEASKAVTPQQGAVYRDYVQELEARTKNILGVEDTSPVARVVGGVTNTVFYFMLSAPASALLNVIGMSVLTMPRIGARYGYAKTNALMLKNAALYASTMPKRSLAPLVTGNFMQVSFPSLVEGAKLNPLLQRAANRFVDDGDINISMTNDIFDLGERPSALYTGKTNTVKKVMSGVFHQAERFNREIALLSAFELAYEKFSKADRKSIRGVVERDPTTRRPLKYTPDEAFDLAIQEARDVAGLTLGDYTRQMKGRIFTIPTVNLIAQFKQYAIAATYNILRDFYEAAGRSYTKAEIEQFRQQMVKDGLSPTVIDQRLDEAEQYRKEIYREGFKRLAGVLGMTYLFGGVVAQPFFSMLGTIISMFAPDDDDEFFDWENWFYNYMASDVGGAAAAIFTKMGMEAKKSEEAGKQLGLALARGPVATVTGTALADRVSLDLKNLWWREGRYSPDARDALTQEAIANFGPAFGLGLNWADAFQLAGEGQYLKAYEKAAPALFSKPATAFRLGTEGATNRAGDVIGGLYPDEFTTWQLAMQSIGLQPEKLALAQKAAIQAKTYQQKVLDRRNALLNRLWMERGTPGFPDALQKANEFSLKFPQVAIDSDAIEKSFDARAEARAQAEAMGAKLDEKLIGRTGPMMYYGMK